MAKSIITLILTLSALTVSAQADRDWWACQFVASAGMQWDGNKWETVQFHVRGPFTLISNGEGSLTTETVAKAMSMGELSHLVACDRELRGSLYCELGGTNFLSFNVREGLGTVASLAGGTQPKGKKRDTPEVSVFECTKGS